MPLLSIRTSPKKPEHGLFSAQTLDSSLSLLKSKLSLQIPGLCGEAIEFRKTNIVFTPYICSTLFLYIWKCKAETLECWCFLRALLLGFSYRWCCRHISPTSQRIGLGEVSLQNVALKMPHPLLLDGEGSLELHFTKSAERTQWLLVSVWMPKSENLYVQNINWDSQFISSFPKRFWKRKNCLEVTQMHGVATNDSHD